LMGPVFIRYLLLLIHKNMNVYACVLIEYLPIKITLVFLISYKPVICIEV